MRGLGNSGDGRCFASRFGHGSNWDSDQDRVSVWLREVHQVSPRFDRREPGLRHYTANRMIYGGFTHARKERMFGRLVREFRETNPNETTMSFGELTKRLKSKYGVQCRSVSNFFKSQLERQTLEGGTRNRRIVLDKGEGK